MTTTKTFSSIFKEKKQNQLWKCCFLVCGSLHEFGMLSKATDVIQILPKQGRKREIDGHKASHRSTTGLKNLYYSFGDFNKMTFVCFNIRPT